MRAWVATLLVLAGLAVPASAAAQQGSRPALLAGVGKADITPPTGFAFGGWTRADRVGRGVHTRLNATALVLQRGDRKVALVALDLFAATGGLVKEAAERNADLGFDERNVLVSASHTHAGPSGFANFQTFNTLAPSLETVGAPSTFVEFFAPRPVDRQLYRFLVERLALAIRQAAKDARPASAAWGQAALPGVTKNRSLEAHLADHGIVKARGDGRPEEDPDGSDHTIDPRVDVLRVDRLVRRRRPCRAGAPAAGKRCLRTVAIPIGAWTMFANHGTINPAEFQVYNNDHHGVATRVFESEVRRIGGASPKRLVVNVYGNGNEGDQSAGLDGRGPAVTEAVGRKEAAAMLDAWRDAGTRLSSRPELDLRWTRACFCGQEVEGGRVASEPLPGVPFLTGSEEGRGPLFDVTKVPFEDRRGADRGDSQGHKIGVMGAASTASVPKAVPLLSVRVGDRIIASLPGEPTVEVGRRVRSAILGATAGSGVNDVVIAGLANEFVLYLTTPEEYDRQHYEGGSTLYGRLASNMLKGELATLSGRLVRGEPAQEPFAFDPRNGVSTDGAPGFPEGASGASVEAEPEPERRVGEEAAFSWRGGERGFDRPLDTPFVTIERRDGETWSRVTDDLGFEIIWTVDDAGRYTARWEVRGGAAPGEHRFVITARRYGIVSRAFAVR